MERFISVGEEGVYLGIVMVEVRFLPNSQERKEGSGRGVVVEEEVVVEVDLDLEERERALTG